MIAIFGLLAIAIVLCWLGFELRSVRRSWSNACFAGGLVVVLLLVGAFFCIYGANLDPISRRRNWQPQGQEQQLRVTTSTGANAAEADYDGHQL